MRIISFIEDLEVIKKILKHLDLWKLKARSPPRGNAPPNNIEPHLDYSARPGAISPPVEGLGYELFQTLLFSYTVLVIVLGQGLPAASILRLPLCR